MISRLDLIWLSGRRSSAHVLRRAWRRQFRCVKRAPAWPLPRWRHRDLENSGHCAAVAQTASSDSTHATPGSLSSARRVRSRRPGKRASNSSRRMRLRRLVPWSRCSTKPGVAQDREALALGSFADRYVEVTAAEFDEHFDKRKVELGACGRPYGAPCAHEQACVRCPTSSPGCSLGWTR
jgi:hypothetical protein